MATLALNKPLKTAESMLVVENALKVGVHRFALVVMTEDGRRSEPMEVSIEVLGTIVFDPRVIETVRPGTIDPLRPPPIDPPRPDVSVQPTPVTETVVRPGGNVLRPGDTVVTRPGIPATPARPGVPGGVVRPATPVLRPGRGPRPGKKDPEE